MNEYPNLSKEELEALLSNDSHAEDLPMAATARTGMRAITTEEALLRLGAGFQALTAKVNYLEERVKELRLQLLQQERTASNTREAAVQRQLQAEQDGDSRDGQAQRAPAAHSDSKLSRLERFGRRGR